MEKLDIKALTRELKMADSNPLTELNENTEKKVPKSKTAIPKDKQKDLELLISEASKKEDFNTEACVYIDSEIHDVLRQLKRRTKLRIGPFVSQILEDFILNHKEEITVLLKHKANRFINK